MLKEHRYALALLFGLPVLGALVAALLVNVLSCPGAPRDPAAAQTAPPDREQRAR